MWKLPATASDIQAAAAHLIAAVEPEASSERVAVVTRLLAAYGYTRAELLLAMRELPRDPEASHNFGRGLNLADVERIVRGSRQMRARLLRPATMSAITALVEAHPELSLQDFRCCGFDERGERLYRYAPGATPHRNETTLER